jgi:hypothetical protein
VKLRSQITLFLLLLGLTPLLASFVINVPLVFDKLESFYHEAYLEKLRTDFWNLFIMKLTWRSCVQTSATWTSILRGGRR